MTYGYLLSFFPNFYADVFCVLEVIKVYSKMLLFENINQNLMFVSASIRFLKTDHYFDTDFRIINMIHLRSLHHSPFYLYFFLPNSKPSLFQQFEFSQRVHKFKLHFQFWGGQSWNVHLCSRQNNCTCPGWKVNTCKHTHKLTMCFWQHRCGCRLRLPFDPPRSMLSVLKVNKRFGSFIQSKMAIVTFLTGEFARVF